MGLKAALNAAAALLPRGAADSVAAFARIHGDYRASYVLAEATRNPELQKMLADAAVSDTPNVIFAKIAAQFDPPPPQVRYAMEPEPRKSLEERVVSDPQIQESVGEFSPGFQARMARGDVTPEEVLEVYGTGPLTPRPTRPLPDAMPRMAAETAPSPLADRVARVRGGSPTSVDDMLERLSGVVDVAGPPAAYRQSVRVRPSRAGFGSGSMDTMEAARAMEVLAPPDVGTSLADTGALGPAAQQIFGVSGPTRVRQVGTQGGGRVLGDVAGPAADLRVRVSGPAGVSDDIMPGAGVSGDMPVGQPGDVIGPAAITEDMITPGGFAMADDVAGPAGAWEGRVGRRSGRVTDEAVASADNTPAMPEASQAVDDAPAATPPRGEYVPPPGESAGDRLRRGASGVAAKRPPEPVPDWRGDARWPLAKAAGGVIAAGGAGYMFRPVPELDEPPPVTSTPDEIVDDAVREALGEIVMEDDLAVPEVEFEPLQFAAPDDIALPPADEVLPEIPALEVNQPILPAPMVGEPIGVQRSDVPAYRRLQEIRNLLQRGGSEEMIRNNPRYADLDDYQREMAVLRGRDLANRRDRVRMAGILSQGGRLPYSQAAAAGDRFLRMNPEEQQDFLAAGGFTPTSRQAMRMAADRVAHRRRLEEIGALGQNQAMVADRQGEWGVRGAEVANEGKRDVAGIAAGVDLAGQKLTAQNAAEDRKLRARELDQRIVLANADAERAVLEGNANRAAQAKNEVARLQVERDRITASDRQAAAANKSRERVAGLNNPAALDPAEALERTAIANAMPKILEILGRSATRSAAYSAIKRDSVANQAPDSFIRRALDQKFPR
jgi:hypothetical protein